MQILYFIIPLLLMNNVYSTIQNNTVKNVNSNNINSIIDNRDSLVKFNDSNNRCGLASLNQCFSILNPSDNVFLQKFKQNYYGISKCKMCQNKIFDPKHIFENLLKNTKFINNINEKEKQFFKLDCDEFLDGREGSDVAERYQRLVNILQNTDCNIKEINAFCELRNYKIQSNNINYTSIIQEGFEIGTPVTDNTVNLIVNNNDITNIDFYKQIKSNQIININNNKFELLALIFLCVNQNGQPNSNFVSHFVSAKKLLSGKWRLIDSSHNNINQIYDNFEQLMNTHVIPNTTNTKISKRLMPKLMFFIKDSKNNNTINSEINNINNQIENNYNIIMQIAKYNGYANNKDEVLAIKNFINNISNNNKIIFNSIINEDLNANKNNIYQYFALYGYSWLFRTSLEIISNILHLQQTISMLQDNK